MSAAIEATDLGRRYGRIWALRGCTLSVPEGCVAALVGPNGAGKTTLLELGVGLLDATEGEVRILGASMRHQPAQMVARVGFVAQDTPLYRNFSVLDMLRFGAHLNPRWDGSIARRRLERLDIPLERHLSSHLISDLERVCDHLILLANGHVVLAGATESLLAEHHLVSRPRDHIDGMLRRRNVIEQRATDRQLTAMVRGNGAVPDPRIEARGVSLEELVLAYLRRPREADVALQVAVSGAGQ